MLAQPASKTHADQLLEIVGNRSNGPKRPRGLVFCDPDDRANGWAVVVVVPNQKRPKAEVRVYGSGGLGRVTSTVEAFALQFIEPSIAKEKYADLLPLVQTVLPRAAQRVALMTQLKPGNNAAPEPTTDGEGHAGLDSVKFASADSWVAAGDEDSLTSPTETGLSELDDDVPLVSAIEVPMASAAPSTADARAAVTAFGALVGALVREMAAVALALFARSVSWSNVMLARAVRSLQRVRGDHKPISSGASNVIVSPLNDIAPSLPAPIDTSKTINDVVDAVARPISAVGTDSRPPPSPLPRFLPSRVAPGLVSVELQSRSRS